MTTPKSNHPPRPTKEQCAKNERLPDWKGWRAYACRYPQIGGYGSDAVVLLNQPGENMEECFEAYVWHDGEFPFAENDERMPAHLHHCDARQFVDFGNWILETLPTRGEDAP